MRIGITVNMGGYESVRFDSNEFPSIEECLMDLIADVKKEVKGKAALARCESYIKSIFGDSWW